MKKYKVLHDLDDIYEVWDFNTLLKLKDEGDYLFKGTLPECEAWINLTEEGYL